MYDKYYSISNRFQNISKDPVNIHIIPIAPIPYKIMLVKDAAPLAA